MISRLKGIVVAKTEKNLTLDVNGVGYLLQTPKTVLENSAVGEEKIFSIHTHVREDAISLYGFQNQNALDFFELLLSVSGIGPKSALEILNSPIDKVRQAIAQKNVAYLTKIPGIGKKTAERIIVDLQNKIKIEILSSEADEETNDEELVQALISLGYHRHQVLQGLKKIPKEVSGEEAVIKYFLQNN